MPRSISRQLSSDGSSTFTSWNRRANAGSFSKYFLYSLQVVAASVRNSPRASAGLSKLAASPCPACPPAPIIVCASSMNRMIGVGEFFASSIRLLRRFSNSPFTPAPAWSSARSNVRIVTFCSAGGTSPLATRIANPSTTAVFLDASFADQNRIVLAAPGENVHHLPYLEIAGQHRIDLPLLGFVGEVHRVLVEVWRLAAAGLPAAPPRRRRSPRRPWRALGLGLLGGLGNEWRRGPFAGLRRGIFWSSRLMSRAIPRQVLGGEDRHERMAGAHVLGAIVDGPDRPCLGEGPHQVRAERRCARVARLEVVEAPREIRDESRPLDAVMAQDERQIIVGGVERLQQKMLDLDVVVRARQAQAGRRLDGIAGIVVELADECALRLTVIVICPAATR